MRLSCASGAKLMTELLLKLFVKNNKDAQNLTVRDSVGKMASSVGIVLNVCLAAFKIIVGALSGVISVVADGLNNLTDCGGNVVSLVGFTLSGKPADSGHPYGHRRIEYVAGLIVGFIVSFVAVELAITGVKNALDPEPTAFSLLTIIALSVSVVVKLWMFVFYRKLGKRYDSELILANSTDSISDVLATAAVILSVFIAKWTGFDRIDGITSAAVAVVIGIAGIKIVVGASEQLMGKSPDAQTISDIVRRIRGFSGVLGIHDLNVHSYGRNTLYASVHVEVDSSVDVMESHDLIDRIERDFAENTNVRLVIHMDPVVVGDPELDNYRKEVEEIVAALDEHFSVHDFRMVRGVTHTNLIFDVAVHFDTKLTDRQIADYIQNEVNRIYENVYVVPTVERQICEENLIEK